MWLNNQIAPYVLKLNLDLNNQFGKYSNGTKIIGNRKRNSKITNTRKGK